MDDAAQLAVEAAVRDLESALQAIPEAPPDEMLRNAMRQMIAAAHRHEAVLEPLMFEPDAAASGSLNAMSARLIPPAMGFLQRLKATGALRPVSDLILARTLLALFLGMIASERALPQSARMLMRMFPERVWIDGMVDLLLYGVLEDEAR